LALLDFSQPPLTAAPQETTWTEHTSARHSLRLEVVTDTRRIVGTAHHPTVIRPVDLLNWTAEALALADIEATPLEGQARVTRRWLQAHVSKQTIVLVIPQEVAPRLPGANKRPLEYVEKRRWQVSVLLPRFIVTGHFHLSSAADPGNASLFWNAGFVPLTDAEALYLPDPGTTWKAPVIIVNTTRAEAYCPAVSLAGE
jgi:hypothetical protein